MADYSVVKYSDIETKIIPFFSKFKIQGGVKAKDFEIFCSVSFLIKEGKHNTEDGLLKIKSLKNQMNKSRISIK